MYDLSYVMLSIKDCLIEVWIALGPIPSFSLKMLSMTDISVEVVSKPQKADQSLTTIPEPITSLPLLTVPAINGIWRSDDNSFCASTLIRGCNKPPEQSIIDN